jgi:hypothetical protein
MKNPKRRRFVYEELRKCPCSIKKKKGLKWRRFSIIQQKAFLPPFNLRQGNQRHFWGQGGESGGVR